MQLTGFDCITIKTSMTFKHLQTAQGLLRNKHCDIDGNMVDWHMVKSCKYMKTELGVIFYRYAYAEKFFKNYLFTCEQPNHSHELLYGYDKISITAAKKKTSENFVSNKSFRLKYMIGLPPCQLRKKQEIVFQNQMLKIQGRTMINANN